MANLKQAKTEDEIKKLTVNNVKKAYNELAEFYNKLINNEIIYCNKCGKWKSVNAFYGSDTTTDGIERFGCKECILNLCTDVSKDGIRTDNKKKTILTFKRLNWYFNEKDYDAQLQTISEGVNERIRATAVQQLIVMIRSLPNWKGLTFEDSEFNLEDTENNSEENTKLVQKTLKNGKKRFGSHFTNEDIMFLENEYQDWVHRYEVNSKVQETIFERLAFKKWEINKATKAGLSTKDLDKSYTDLLSSVNLLPRQNSNNGFNESLCFGQMIEQWEEHDPVFDPDPEFADVDNIGKYIRVWFKGHLSRALGFDNGYSKEYDDYIKEYTVSKAKYEEDDTCDDIYQKLFGNGGE